MNEWLYAALYKGRKIDKAPVGYNVCSYNVCIYGNCVCMARGLGFIYNHIAALLSNINIYFRPMYIF